MIQRVDLGLYRGPRPEGGLKELHDLGITNIISLQSGIYELLYQDVYEDQIPGRFGMVRDDVHLSDFFRPSADRLIEIVRLIAHYRAQPKGMVYVHCKRGRDRTGLVIAAHRMLKQAWPYDAAVNELREKGGCRFPYWGWVKSLKELEGLHL